MKFLVLTSILKINLDINKDLNFFKVLEKISIAEGMLFYVL